MSGVLVLALVAGGCAPQNLLFSHQLAPADSAAQAAAVSGAPPTPASVPTRAASNPEIPAPTRPAPTPAPTPEVSAPTSAAQSPEVTAAVAPVAPTSSEAPSTLQQTQDQATVQITYARPRDYLKVLSVTEYFGAHVLPADKHGRSRPGSSILRLDGGRLMWVVQADTGVRGAMFTNFPRLSGLSRFAVSSVTYGKVPPYFAQVDPPDGEPQQGLEEGHYYAFSAERGSGSTTYFLVRGEADGKLVGYSAEPRAGDSFEICCNVAQDFAPPEEQPAVDSAR